MGHVSPFVVELDRVNITKDGKRVAKCGVDGAVLGLAVSVLVEFDLQSGEAAMFQVHADMVHCSCGLRE